MKSVTNTKVAVIETQLTGIKSDLTDIKSMFKDHLEHAEKVHSELFRRTTKNREDMIQIKTIATSLAAVISTVVGGIGILISKLWR